MAVQAVSPKYLAPDPGSYIMYMPQSAVPGPGVSRMLYCEGGTTETSLCSPETRSVTSIPSGHPV